MKRYIAFTFLLSLTAFAADPATVCNENPLCTEPMQRIVAAYKIGHAQFSERPLTGFSGSCFYISSLYDSSHEHHGAFLFERNSESLLATGIFSFFAKEDPYQHMNSLELKQWFVDNGSSFSPTQIGYDAIELQYLGLQSDFHYWFRSNSTNDKLFVLGQQFATGQNSEVFCEMSAR